MKTETKRPDKRQRILTTAIALFNRTHDVKKVSLETIAREARVSPTTIYNYFGTRESLLYEVIKVLVRQNLERNRALVGSDAPFSQKMTGIIAGKLEMVSDLGGELIAKIVSQDRVMAPFIDEIYREEIRPLWLEMLADGKKQGYIDPALDDEALLVYLDVLKAGFSARPDLLQHFQENMGLIEEMTRIMFYGFLRKDFDLFKREKE